MKLRNETLIFITLIFIETYVAFNQMFLKFTVFESEVDFFHYLP